MTASDIILLWQKDQGIRYREWKTEWM